MPNGINTLISASWHDRYPGETRIRPYLPSLVSFYDTELVPSLVQQRRGKSRWDHRLLGISSEDAAAVRARLESVLLHQQQGSGIDWEALIRTIVNRYATRLELLQYLLANDAIQNRTEKISMELRAMVVPYRLVSAQAPGDQDVGLDWARPVHRECARSHTAFISESAYFQSRMTASEKLLLRAVSGTHREICRIVVRMWAEGVASGMAGGGSSDGEHAMLTRWLAQVNDLMGWLDWSVWVRCRPECSMEVKLPATG